MAGRLRKRGNSEGSIYKRKDGRWAATLTLGYEGGKRRRKTFYGRTRQDVARRLNVAVHQTEQGLPLPSDRQTLGTYLQGWLAHKAERLRPRTFKRISEIVGLHIVPVLGPVPVGQLRPQHVQFLITRKLQEGLSPRTVQITHGTLRNALAEAVRLDLVPRNVATLVTSPRVLRPEIQPLSPAEAAAFLRAARGDRLEGLYRVALGLGLRQGEALGLRWRDVDLDEGRLQVRVQLQRYGDQWTLTEPKSARARRTITLPPPINRALREHRARQLGERLAAGSTWDAGWDLVFVTRLGRPLDARNVTRSFRAITRRAGIRDVRFHDLRHTAASFLLAQGVDLRTVMEVLGHSQIGLTANTYMHVLPALRADAADRMGALLEALDSDGAATVAVNVAVNPSQTGSAVRENP